MSLCLPGKEQLFESLPLYYSHLYLAVEGMLSAVICIEDPLRDEAAAVVTSLKKAGYIKGCHDDRRQ